MAEPKKVKTRIINKHATAAVWDSKPNFIPLQAELIIYDKDDQYAYETSLLEQYGSKSIITFEDWLEIKGLKDLYNKLD